MGIFRGHDSALRFALFLFKLKHFFLSIILFLKLIFQLQSTKLLFPLLYGPIPLFPCNRRYSEAIRLCGRTYPYVLYSESLYSVKITE